MSAIRARKPVTNARTRIGDRLSFAHLVLVAVVAIGSLSAGADAAPNDPIGPPIGYSQPAIAIETSEIIESPGLSSETATNDLRPGAAAIERTPLGVPTATAAPGAASPLGDSSMSRTILSLAAVIALIFVTRWIVRRLASRAGGMAAQLGPAGRAPSGVLNVLARYPVARGQSLVLLKMDQRVLLLSQSSDGFRTIAEVTDPDEVASLIIRTRDEEGESLAAKFTSMLKRFERDPEFGDRSGMPSRTPTTVEAALRLFPETRSTASRAQSSAGADRLAAIRARLASMDGGAS